MRRYQEEPAVPWLPNWVLAATCLALPAALWALTAPAPFTPALPVSLFAIWFVGLALSFVSTFAGVHPSPAPLLAHIGIIVLPIGGFCAWVGPIAELQRTATFRATYAERMDVVRQIEAGELRPKNGSLAAEFGSITLPPAYAHLVKSPYIGESQIYYQRRQGALRLLFYLAPCYGVLYSAGPVNQGEWFNSGGVTHMVTRRIDDHWHHTHDDYFACGFPLPGT